METFLAIGVGIGLSLAGVLSPVGQFKIESQASKHVKAIRTDVEPKNPPTVLPSLANATQLVDRQRTTGMIRFIGVRPNTVGVETSLWNNLDENARTATLSAWATWMKERSGSSTFTVESSNSREILAIYDRGVR